jgi:hypothetical protein
MNTINYVENRIYLLNDDVQPTSLADGDASTFTH